VGCGVIARTMDNADMSQIVEVSLRLPARPQLKSPLFPYGVAGIRFIKQTELESLPKTDELFTKPKVEQTEAYITGRFG